MRIVSFILMNLIVLILFVNCRQIEQNKEIELRDEKVLHQVFFEHFDTKDNNLLVFYSTKSGCNNFEKFGVIELSLANSTVVNDTELIGFTRTDLTFYDDLVAYTKKDLISSKELANFVFSSVLEKSKDGTFFTLKKGKQILKKVKLLYENDYYSDDENLLFSATDARSYIFYHQETDSIWELDKQSCEKIEQDQMYFIYTLSKLEPRDYPPNYSVTERFINLEDNEKVIEFTTPEAYSCNWLDNNMNKFVYSCRGSVFKNGKYVNKNGDYGLVLMQPYVVLHPYFIYQKVISDSTGEEIGFEVFAYNVLTNELKKIFNSVIR